MASGDPQQKTVQKIKRLRELRSLLINYHHTADVRPHKTDLIKQVEVQIAWLERRLSTGPDTGEYSHA